ncbi:MAG: CDP-alcohol phosphatidyltransferase family protein [Clostridia bacterium]|nr:CDP-alcohol phosphatidyltransferase family protein [Clostridia bacterium]MBQ2325384.1 CDP-alcohol phosphatidyltransferase family protein [Clostridia bacterium]
MFIGFINLANVITLGGLCSSALAVFCAANHDYCLALTFFLLAGICDMTDGTAARRSKGRSDRAKVYGIQLDSLCDMVSFGVTPCMIAWFLGYDSFIDIIVYMLFLIASATRLAYFNTLTMEKADLSSKSFVGMPIPFSCFSTAVLMMMLSFGLAPAGMAWAFRVVYLLVAMLYVLRIKIPKPPLKIAIIFGALIAVIYVLTMLRWGGNSVTEGIENYIKLKS